MARRYIVPRFTSTQVRQTARRLLDGYRRQLGQVRRAVESGSAPADSKPTTLRYYAESSSITGTPARDSCIREAMGDERYTIWILRSRPGLQDEKRYQVVDVAAQMLQSEARYDGVYRWAAEQRRGQAARRTI